MHPDRKRLFLALGLAALAAIAAATWSHLEERRLLHQGEEVKVLAAKRYLPAYTRLEASQVAWMTLPRAYAPEGAVTEANAALGLQTLVPFSEGEPLIFNKLALGEQSLAASVPEGLRAVSIPVNGVSGVSGLLKAGDHVDVLLLHGQGPQARAGALLQDCAVLAVGANLTRAEAQRGDGPGTVTLALSPADAVLALAAGSGGQLHLALRASGDSRPSGAGPQGFPDVLRRLEHAPASAAPASAAPIEAGTFIPRKR